jgi:hypothetical protein
MNLAFMPVKPFPPPHRLSSLRGGSLRRAQLPVILDVLLTANG